MTSFTSLPRPYSCAVGVSGSSHSRKHFASVQMPAKHTSHEQYIFITDTSIMTARWLNWKLPARPLPNDPRIFAMMGFIQRRQGRWEESTRNLERALELDPRNINTLVKLADSYGGLRRYAEQKSMVGSHVDYRPERSRVRKQRAHPWKWIGKLIPARASTDR